MRIWKSILFVVLCPAIISTRVDLIWRDLPKKYLEVEQKFVPKWIWVLNKSKSIFESKFCNLQEVFYQISDVIAMGLNPVHSEFAEGKVV